MDGKNTTEPEMVVVIFEITLEEAEKLAVVAEAESRTVSQQVRHLVRQELRVKAMVAEAMAERHAKTSAAPARPDA